MAYRVRRNYYRVLASLVTVLLSVLCFGCAPADTDIGSVSAVEVTLAVGRDCPSGASEALTDLCDNIYATTDGRVHVQLQNWDDPLTSDADIIFQTSQSLKGTGELFALLTSDFVFSSPQHMDTTLNAQSVLEMLSRELVVAGHPYTAQYALYCGKTYLLVGESEFLTTMRSSSTAELRLAVRDIRDGYTPVEPLENYPADTPRTVYYATTDQLLSGENAPAPLTLVESSIQMLPGFILTKNDLNQRLTPEVAALLLEGLSTVKPDCDGLYNARDAELRSRYLSRWLSPRYLRAVVRTLQEELPGSPMFSPLLGIIDGYDR